MRTNCNIYCTVTLPNNKLVIVDLNNCLLYLENSKVESLLQHHEARAFGIVGEDVSG